MQECHPIFPVTIFLCWGTRMGSGYLKNIFLIFGLYNFEILQLDPAVLKHNMLMPALWFGFSKPNMATFLTPFAEELQELSSGFRCIKQEVAVNQSLCSSMLCEHRCSVCCAKLQTIQRFPWLLLLLPPGRIHLWVLRSSSRAENCSEAFRRGKRGHFCSAC